MHDVGDMCDVLHALFCIPFACARARAQFRGFSSDAPSLGSLSGEGCTCKVSVYVTTPTLQTFTLYRHGEIEDSDDDSGDEMGILSQQVAPYAHQREDDGNYPAIRLLNYTGQIVVELLHDAAMDETEFALYLCGGPLEPW